MGYDVFEITQNTVTIKMHQHGDIAKSILVQK